ncbi:hypothetical protein FHT77_005977 [Rhizobium sp. BK181]|uniref:hypothetical protein n=1 Tax=Rhizobium sp. BK181 TaxID=2587072 RepID=UPI001613FF73|nr:hypothetical protein [Rhizobium sp. BK181]MBB3320058.1 hypothetical protein [Rhizobium sp. BK181]
MRKLMIITFCCLSSGAHGADQATVKDVVGWARDGNQEFVALLTGVGRGVEGANMTIGFKQRELTLYCQPNIAITGDQYLRIIGTHIERHPERGNLEPALIGIVMTMALIEAFPCK